jgi:hypothetical protein
VDEHTTGVLQQYGDGEVIRVKLMKDRNPRHHRLFFGILSMVYLQQEKYLSQEALRFAVMIQSGYVDEIRLTGDTVVLKPKSMSFGSMDQHEFSLFYKASLEAIPQLLPNFEGVDLEKALATGDAP